MIKKECFTSEWIRSIARKTRYTDLNIIEKVIRVLSLLELLKSSGCPFCFRGGSALMLISGRKCASLVDRWISFAPGTDIESYLKDIEQFGFVGKKLEDRQQRGIDVPKSHSW